MSAHYIGSLACSSPFWWSNDNIIIEINYFPIIKVHVSFLHSYIVQTCAGDKYLTSYFRGSIQSFLQDTEAPFHITERLLNRITRRTYFSIESEIFLRKKQVSIQGNTLYLYSSLFISMSFIH